MNIKVGDLVVLNRDLVTIKVVDSENDCVRFSYSSIDYELVAPIRPFRVTGIAEVRLEGEIITTVSYRGVGRRLPLSIVKLETSYKQRKSLDKETETLFK